MYITITPLCNGNLKDIVRERHKIIAFNLGFKLCRKISRREWNSNIFNIRCKQSSKFITGFYEFLRLNAAHRACPYVYMC